MPLEVSEQRCGPTALDADDDDVGWRAEIGGRHRPRPHRSSSNPARGIDDVGTVHRVEA